MALKFPTLSLPRSIQFRCLFVMLTCSFQVILKEFQRTAERSENDAFVVEQLVELLQIRGHFQVLVAQRFHSKN